MALQEELEVQGQQNHDNYEMMLVLNEANANHMVRDRTVQGNLHELHQQMNRMNNEMQAHTHHMDRRMQELHHHMQHQMQEEAEATQQTQHLMGEELQAAQGRMEHMENQLEAAMEHWRRSGWWQ